MLNYDRVLHKVNKKQKQKDVITIRLANFHDVPRIVELDHEAFAWSGTSENEITFKHRLQAYPQGCILIEINTIVVGYCTAEKWLTEREPELDQDPLMTHQPSGQVFCITAIAITKRYQHQGLGSLLLLKIIEIAKTDRCFCILLETGKAITWYEKFGFRKIGDRTQNGAKMSIVRLQL